MTAACLRGGNVTVSATVYNACLRAATAGLLTFTGRLGVFDLSASPDGPVHVSVRACACVSLASVTARVTAAAPWHSHCRVAVTSQHTRLHVGAPAIEELTPSGRIAFPVSSCRAAALAAIQSLRSVQLPSRYVLCRLVDDCALPLRAPCSVLRAPCSVLLLLLLLLLLLFSAHVYRCVDGCRFSVVARWCVVGGCLCVSVAAAATAIDTRTRCLPSQTHWRGCSTAVCWPRLCAMCSSVPLVRLLLLLLLLVAVWILLVALLLLLLLLLLVAVPATRYSLPTSRRGARRVASVCITSS
jgi:hypothetical protein